jgi:hypothetical protein
MANVSDKDFIAEITKARDTLPNNTAVVAVLQNKYPQYGRYIIQTNMDRQKAMAALLDRSASKVTEQQGTLQ